MGKLNQEKTESLKKLLQNLLKTDRQFSAARQKMGEMDPMETTDAARGRVNNRILSLAENIERNLHEAHCLAVEIGIADIRDDRHYGDHILHDGWHKNAWNKRRPQL